MRESRTSGSGRGDQGNPVPYRHRLSPVASRLGEGRLTEPKAAARPWRPELVLMPEAVEKRVMRRGRRAVLLGHDGRDGG